MDSTFMNVVTIEVACVTCVHWLGPLGAGLCVSPVLYRSRYIACGDACIQTCDTTLSWVRSTVGSVTVC